MTTATEPAGDLVASVRTTTPPGGLHDKVYRNGYQATLYRRVERKRDGFPVWEFVDAFGTVFGTKEPAIEEAQRSGHPYEETARNGGPALRLEDIVPDARGRTLVAIGNTGEEWGFAYQPTRWTPGTKSGAKMRVFVARRDTNGSIPMWRTVRYLGDFRGRQWDDLRKWARSVGLKLIHVDPQTGELPKAPGERILARRQPKTTTTKEGSR